MKSIKWMGKETSRDAFLALYRSPVGTAPFLRADCGVHGDAIDFIDWSGTKVRALPGDTIHLTDAGWMIEPKEPR